MASPSCGDSQHSAGPPPLSRKQRRRRAKTLRQRAKRRAAYAAAAAQATEESDTDEEEAAEAARQHEALEAAWKQRDVELQVLTRHSACCGVHWLIPGVSRHGGTSGFS